MLYLMSVTTHYRKLFPVFIGKLKGSIVAVGRTNDEIPCCSNNPIPIN